MEQIADPKAFTTDFLDKVKKRECVVATIGLGYVGLPLMLGFHSQGFPMLGFDIDRAKVDALMRGESYIGHIPADKIGEIVETGRFRATDDFSEIKTADAILICVPTPLNNNREPDVSYIVSTAQSIAHIFKRDNS